MSKTNERLIEIRKLSGLSRERVAELLDMKYANYTHYETGRNKISLEFGVEVCDVLEFESGNQFIYLATGLKAGEYLSSKAGQLALEGDFQRGAFVAFKEVIRRALRRGFITAKSDQSIDDISEDFADLINQVTRKTQNIKEAKAG
jgi:transcriptional regulator with XRE-family HTH domain